MNWSLLIIIFLLALTVVALTRTYQKRLKQQHSGVRLKPDFLEMEEFQQVVGEYHLDAAIHRRWVEIATIERMHVAGPCHEFRPDEAKRAGIELFPVPTEEVGEKESFEHGLVIAYNAKGWIVSQREMGPGSTFSETIYFNDGPIRTRVAYTLGHEHVLWVERKHGDEDRPDWWERFDGRIISRERYTYEGETLVRTEGMMIKPHMGTALAGDWEELVTV